MEKKRGRERAQRSNLIESTGEPLPVNSKIAAESSQKGKKGVKNYHHLRFWEVIDNLCQGNLAKLIETEAELRGVQEMNSQEILLSHRQSKQTQTPLRPSVSKGNRSNRVFVNGATRSSGVSQ